MEIDDASAATFAASAVVVAVDAPDDHVAAGIDHAVGPDADAAAVVVAIVTNNAASASATSFAATVAFDAADDVDVGDAVGTATATDVSVVGVVVAAATPR